MMEIEQANSTKIMAKKVWNIFRIMLMMVKKGISKSKLVMVLHLFLKRGNELAGKAMNGLIVHHNALICKPSDPNQHFISPKDYEFSCGNSPELGLMMPHHKKSSWLNRRGHRYNLEDSTTVAAVQRVLEMLNANQGVAPAASPMGTGANVQGHQSASPGFGGGKSPTVRELRITDSPFPLKDGKGNEKEEEEDVKVNKAADEFIKRFYNNLKMQKSLESPCHKWAHDIFNSW